ncbi:hypothetical protein ACVJBD_000670 [Rhizobium mongolense]
MKTEAARKAEKPSTGRDRINFEFRTRRITRENDAAGFWRVGAGMGDFRSLLTKEYNCSRADFKAQLRTSPFRKTEQCRHRAAINVMELDHATIGAQDLSVDPGAVRTSEEGNGSGDVVGPTEAFERVHLRHAGNEFV